MKHYKHGLSVERGLLICEHIAFGVDPHITKHMWEAHQKEHHYNKLAVMMNCRNLFAKVWIRLGNDKLIPSEDLEPINECSRLNQNVLNTPFKWKYRIPMTNSYFLFNKNKSMCVLAHLEQ